jgi:PAS domain S-box-containing protein
MDKEPAAVAAKRVLLIEDDPRDAELACIWLERAGIPIDARIVAAAAEVERALDEETFELVLSDFQLPGFSGEEALRIVRQRDAHTPFIFMSGMLGEENAVEMLKQGATDYVLKQRPERLPLVITRALTEAGERRQREHAEHRLRESERHFSQLIDALKDYSVATLDREGRIQSWNAASENIFGYTAAEIIGQRIALFFEQSGREALARSELEGALSGESHVDERWLRRRDGSRFHASIVTTSIVGEDGTLRGFSRIVRDTTDSRIAADLLQSAKEQAESANLAKDRFLAVLSHELRNPLSPIAAAAQFLHMQDLPADARECVAVIKRNVELESRLIDDLLDISRIVNDKLPLSLEDVELVALASGVVDAFLTDADSRRIDLQFESLERRVFVHGDPARLQQIIWNLVKNALKFTTARGRVTVRIDTPDPQHCTITVADTGIGIHADALQRIFNAFDQGDISTQADRSGLGLGLAIANSLAQKHGGTLTVHSDGVGRGACFTLTLKRQVTQEASKYGSPFDLALETPQSGAPHSMRILVVEDNVDSSATLQALLDRIGHDVSVAGSVNEARALLADRTFDVLLSDMGLPDGDGIDVLRYFRANGSGIAIALTGYGMYDDVERCLAAGFTEHMTKPLNFDRLRAALNGTAPRSTTP